MATEIAESNDALTILSGQILFCALTHPASVLEIKKRLLEYFYKNFNISSTAEIEILLSEHAQSLINQIYGDDIIKQELKRSFIEPIETMFTHIFELTEDVAESEAVKYAQIISNRDSTSELLNVLAKNTTMISLSATLARVLPRVISGNEIVKVCKYVDSIFENGGKFDPDELDEKLAPISKRLLLSIDIPKNKLADVNLQILYGLPNLYDKSNKENFMSFLTKQGYAYKMMKNFYKEY